MARFVHTARYPVVTANVVDQEGRLLTAAPYVVLKANGVRVGVIGELLGDMIQYTTPDKMGPWHALPVVETVRKYADELRGQADDLRAAARMKLDAVLLPKVERAEDLTLAARALSAAKDAGVSRVEDPEATSTVLVAALAYLPIVQLLIRRTPGKLDADRFREAWLRLAEGAFTGVPPT